MVFSTSRYGILRCSTTPFPALRVVTLRPDPPLRRLIFDVENMMTS
jgi:hypothetical protein